MASLVSAHCRNVYPRSPFLGNVSSLWRPGRRCLRSNAATDDPRPAVSSAKTEDLAFLCEEKHKEIISLKSQLEAERAGREAERAGRERDHVVTICAVLELCIWLFVVWAINVPEKPKMLNVAGLAIGFRVMRLMSTIVQFGLKHIVSKVSKLVQSRR